MNVLTIEDHGRWSLGVLVGLPVLVLLLLAALVATSLFLRAFRRVNPNDLMADDNRFLLGLGIGFSVVVTIALALVIGLGFYPYNAEYHQYRQASGTVSSTNSRLIGADKSTTQKFVVTFAGDPQQYGCDDTRCAAVKVGDQLTLTCKRSWQWFGTPGYDCNFVSSEAK